MKEGLKEYLLLTVLGHLGRRERASCWFLVVGREELVYELRRFSYCLE